MTEPAPTPLELERDALKAENARLKEKHAELRRAAAGLVRFARTVESGPLADIVDVEGALGCTAEQAIDEFRQQVEFAAEKRVKKAEARALAAEKERDELVEEDSLRYRRAESRAITAEKDLVALGSSLIELKTRALAAEAKLQTAREALRVIAQGRGPFSNDQLEFAGNCIESMKSIAEATIAALGGGE